MVVNKSGFQYPKYLVDTDWLETNIDAPDLRIFDCTVHVEPNPDLDERKKYPFIFKNGRAGYDQEHIPGAGFIDIAGDLSDPVSDLPLTMPGAKQFSSAMGACGIGNDSLVVLYSHPGQWACRVWWMLRAFGFDAVILDGGWKKWVGERRAVSVETCKYPTAEFIPKPRAGIFVSGDEVLAAVGDESTSTVCALPAEMFSGSSPMSFGRKGRIAGSINIPFDSLYDPVTDVFLHADRLREIFESAGVSGADKVIAYCGSGIASSVLAYVLTLLGHGNISVYDASMCEWGNDHSLPMAAG